MDLSVAVPLIRPSRGRLGYGYRRILRVHIRPQQRRQDSSQADPADAVHKRFPVLEKQHIRNLRKYQRMNPVVAAS